MKFSIFISFLVCAVMTSIYSQSTHQVTTSGTTFVPETLNVVVGDIISFTPVGSHSMTEVAKSTWDNNNASPVIGFNTTVVSSNSTFNINSAGNHYFVCIPHASMGMKGLIIASETMTIGSVTGKPDFNIAPNPASNFIQVYFRNYASAKNYSLNILDITGRSIYKSSKIAANSFSISTTEFRNGIYILQIIDNDNFQIQSKKFMINK